MTEQSVNQKHFAQDQAGRKITVGLFVALIIAIVAFAGIGARYFMYGDLNAIHCLLSLFFSVNLLICYWEVCLFLHRDYVKERAIYWFELCREKNQSAARLFFFSKVRPRQLFATSTWADVWAAYARYDGSYADRKTFGYSADIANGFVTPIPTLILYSAYTFEFMPALYAGIVGVMLFWQLVYVTSVYWVSFFSAKRQHKLTRHEICIYIIAINSYWVLCALMGLYVSFHLIVNGDYAVLG